MTNYKEPKFHSLYKSINKPLTIRGAERNDGCSFSLIMGADVQMLRVLLNSSKFRTQYDPAKRRDGPAVIRRAA